jgi:hypothetical protein
MVITCVSCGSDRFRAGELELAPDGGYTVVMPCADCGVPHTILHDDDTDFAKALLDFFNHADEVDTFTHQTGPS